MPATAHSTRQAHTDQRRAAILDAALYCFTEKGFTATTIEDVRRRSGASVGSIYHHFANKEQLAGALYVAGLESYHEGLLDALRRHADADAEAGIRAMVRHHLRWVEANPDLARFLFAGGEAKVILNTEATVRELNRVAFSETAAWLETHVKAGRIRRLPTDLYYAILIGPSQEFARHWLHGRMRSSIRQAERALAQAAWNAIAITDTGG
jgi:AcrR family transcriptional regulator